MTAMITLNIGISIIILFILILNNKIVIGHDPRPLIYPGKVNIGVLISLHSAFPNSTECDRITAYGRNHFQAMSTVWSMHMFNQSQRLNNYLSDDYDDVGVHVFDTCEDPNIAVRQSVRLVTHSRTLDNALAYESRKLPPLIGVIAYDENRLNNSLNVLESFGVPIIIASEKIMTDIDKRNRSIFSVTANIRHLAKAAVSFTQSLKWKSPTIVSDDDTFDRQYLTSFARQLNYSIILRPVYDLNYSADNDDVKVYGNDDDDFIEYERESLSLRNISSKMILFLNQNKALDLINKILRDYNTTHSLNLGATNYSWIIVTNKDITSFLKTQLSNYFSPNHRMNTRSDQKRVNGVCQLKNGIFLLSPMFEETQEFRGFFETILQRNGVKSDQPLVAEFAKSIGQIDVPMDSVSSMVKAVWTLSKAYTNLQIKYCPSSTVTCNLRRWANLTLLMAESIKTLNATIDNSKLEQIDGTKLTFDDNHQLTSLKYKIRAVTTNCEIVPIGSFTADDGLNVDGKWMKTFTMALTGATVLNGDKNHNKTSRIKTTRKTSVNNQRNPLLAKTSLRSLRASPLLLSYASNNNVFKSAVLNYQQNSVTSVPPSNLLRSNLRQQTSLGKMAIINQSYVTTTTIKPDSSHVTRRRHVSLTAWLGNGYSLTILTCCIIGVLMTLYVQTFLLMKSCEGALRKANQSLSVCHLLAIMTTFLGSALYVFFPTKFMCSIRTSVHNVSLSMLFGSLLLRAMHVRAQRSIGLGGRSSRMNQFLTMIFIVGIQLSLEIQQWKYESPWNSDSAVKNNNLCSSDVTDYLISQIYLALIVALLIIVSSSARNTPFNQREGNQIFFISIVTLPIFVASLIAYSYTQERKYRDIIISLSMIAHSTAVLLGLYVPLLITIHKYGVFKPPKGSSYADSLSTIFTTFGGNRLRDLDNHSLSSGRSAVRRKKMLQTYEVSTTDSGANFFARVSPNHYTVPCNSGIKHVNPLAHHHLHPSNGSSSSCSASPMSKRMIPNSLYEGVPGFRSAYP